MAEAGAQVTSVEIDPDIAEQARARLGGSVRVVTADGKHGRPADAPYDSVIATAGAQTIPVAWVEQTRVGGRLVVPLTREWYSPGIAVLTRTDTGAVGHLGGPAAFMGLRGQPTPRPRGTGRAGDVQVSATELHPYYLAQDRAAGVAIGQRVTGITWAWHTPDNSYRGRLLLYAEPSWASIDARTGPPYEVKQAGPRRLVDEVQAGYRWWHDAGEPALAKWTVHVGLDGHQHLELTD